MSKQKQQPKVTTNKNLGKPTTQKRSMTVRPVPSALNPSKPTASGGSNQSSGSGKSSSNNSSNKKK